MGCNEARGDNGRREGDLVGGRVVKDSGWSKKIVYLFQRYDLTIGIHAEKGTRNKGKLTNAQVGACHEFPNSKVPHRPFLRPIFDENLKRYQLFLVRSHGQAVVRMGQSPTISFQRLGMKIVADIKNRIRDRIPPELSQSTIDKKKSSTPLIDTAQMLNSIDYKVHDGGID